MQVLVSKDTEEWYTPQPYIDAVRQVLGRIDLDPASSLVANRVVQAERIFTRDDDGLAHPWSGTVFLNPPYNGNAAAWSNYLLQEYQAGRVEATILLVSAKLGYGWFEDLWDAHPVCFCRERISFVRADGDASGEAKHASAFLYVGPDRERFREVFKSFGRVIFPDEGR
jgi:hypothetical protein